MRACALEEGLRWWRTAGFCDGGGEVRGGVSWSDGGGCWRVESPYLDTVWQMERDGLWTMWTVPQHKNGVFVHLCVCCAKGGRGGTCFPQRPIDCRGCGGVEEGWGCTLIPHIDLWPQHQPTCLEFHYRRGKTDGRRGASGSFWGLSSQQHSVMKVDKSVARK